MRGAITTLARYYARRECKREWQRQGRKLCALHTMELTRMANAYLHDHPELLEEAERIITSDPRFAFIQKSGRKRRARSG